MEQNEPKRPVVNYKTELGEYLDAMTEKCHHLLDDDVIRGDIVQLTKPKENVGFVALDESDNVLGYIIFSRPENASNIEILGLGLRDPENQNSTHIATELIDRVMSLTSPRRQTLKVEFPDSYDATIKLFKNLGFKPICKKDTMYFTSQQDPYLQRLAERFKAATGVDWQVEVDQRDDCNWGEDEHYIYTIKSTTPIKNAAGFINAFSSKLGRWEKDNVCLNAKDGYVTVTVSNSAYPSLPRLISRIDHYMAEAIKGVPSQILTIDASPKRQQQSPDNPFDKLGS